MADTRDRSNDHSQRLADAEHCPVLTGNAKQRAQRAHKDATDFVLAIREEEPRVVWGRIARWIDDHPQRLIATLAHLAAMVDPDQEIATWTREFGGLPALHPDYRPDPKVELSLRARTPELEAQIVALARDSQLSDIQIAARFGMPVSYVDRVRRAGGVLRRPTQPGRPGQDAEIAEMTAKGVPTEAIARQVGVSERTVVRARSRHAARRDASAA